MLVITKISVFLPNLHASSADSFQSPNAAKSNSETATPKPRSGQDCSYNSEFQKLEAHTMEKPCMAEKISKRSVKFKI